MEERTHQHFQGKIFQDLFFFSSPNQPPYKYTALCELFFPNQLQWQDLLQLPSSPGTHSVDLD